MSIDPKFVELTADVLKINILTNFFLLRVLGWCIPGICGVGRSSLLAERSSFLWFFARPLLFLFLLVLPVVS